MSSYYITEVSPSDKNARDQVDRLLQAEGIRRDGSLDYTCAMYDDEMHVIATGSCFGNTLRCMAVSSDHQGEGLMNEIVTHLIGYQITRGNSHLFLYTKCDSAKFFGDLGFHEIVRIDGQIVFMENHRSGFSGYLKNLEKETESKCSGYRDVKSAAIVMNANPFTLGHLYLVEKACAENDLVHLFMVSEDSSLVPFAVRKRLILEGTAHLPNLVCHESGPYIISNATFPSYFQKDEAAAIESHAWLDLQVFARIANALAIRTRYVGEEPSSLVTGIYNRIMQDELPRSGIACVIVPRKTISGKEDGRTNPAGSPSPISASTVRQCLKEGNFDALKTMVPESTLRYFRSSEAEPVLARIRAEKNVVHY
ncbi:MAG: [Blautia sp.]|nr:[citrate (pro-3S)-lyase] ligase [Blautia sp.]